MQQRRFDDALLVAETCLKLDPYNGQVRGLVDSVKGYKKDSSRYEQAAATFARMEEDVRKNPGNFQTAFDLAGAYLQIAQTDRAVQVLNGVLNYPKTDASALRGLVQAYSSFGNRDGLQKTADKLAALVQAKPPSSQAIIGLAEAYRHLQKPEAALPALDAAFSDPNLDGNAVLALASAYASAGNASRLEAALGRLTKVMPSNPEAWYDLAAVKAQIGKPTEAIPALKQALDLSAERLKRDPKARDLLASARKEERFAPLRQSPEFKTLVPP